MIKVIKRWLLSFCTLLLIISGAAMPFGISWLQDSQAEKAVETRQFSPVSLTLQQQSDIGQVLQLMSNGVYWFNYEGQTHLSEDEAINCAKEAIKALSDDVMIMPLNTESTVDIELTMAVSTENNAISALIWICSFNNMPGDNYIVMLDDASGKMVEFVAYNQYNRYDIAKPYVYTDGIVENNAQVAVSRTISIENWITFCKNYYGIVIVDWRVWDGKDFWQCLLTYEENNLDEINEYYIPLLFTPDSLQFNK